MHESFCQKMFIGQNCGSNRESGVIGAWCSREAAESVGSGASQPYMGLNPGSYYLQAIESWGNYLTSLSLSFFLCEMEK